MKRSSIGKNLLLIWLVVAALPVMAQTTERDSTQHTLTVMDAETRMVVRDVLVYLPSGEHVRTNWEGCFVIQTDKFDHFKLRHPKYYDRYVFPSDIAESDTLLILPRVGNIDEVVIYGHRKDKQTKLDALSSEVGEYVMKTYTPKPGINADIAGMLDFKGKARRKRLERTKKVLEKY